MILSLLLLSPILILADDGILYPRASKTRELISLDGMWNFVIDNENKGYQQRWYKTHLKLLANSTFMPVPSSYNDVSTKSNVRDHVGVVWYERSFFVPKSWTHQRVMVRFGSVSYSAEVWINGELATAHQIGHLPFETDITKLIKFRKENKITVACDNTLLPTSIPQGSIGTVKTDEGIKISQSYTFDFFNYAGIQRPVLLYTTHKTNYITDVNIRTNFLEDQKTGIIGYQINVKNNTKFKIKMIIYDNVKNIVNETISTNIQGLVIIAQVKLWWPYLMDKNPGYLYNLEIHLIDLKETIVYDVYNLPFGVRTLIWSDDAFLINNKPIYLHGFGKHEDSDIRGKGVDLPTIMKDFNLIEWIGANAFRTSHYPYAEEIMDMADALGIMVIDECPAVNIENFSEELLANHKESIKELVQRDKNRPSVIAWSIANEPRSTLQGAEEYFREIAEFSKSLDETRPITASLNRGYNEDKLAQFLDIISFNRYNSWYQNEGRLDMIINNVISEAENWRRTFSKPVLMSEYGADTMEGLHIYPEYIWSEEYQVTVMSKHFEAFDKLRKQGWFIGEFIWNFADFKTSQKTTRVGGNKKGIFTRNRQPKAAAHHLRKRYFKLANELYNTSIPEGLDNYIFTFVTHKDEL